jgi:hypothetical protein
MTPAAAQPHTHYTLADSDQGSHRVAGLLIVSLFPALFWTGLLALVGGVIGQPLDPLALATIGAAIAAFLAAVVTALREE